MSITITGGFIIIIGVLLFLISNKWLFGLTVFFIPFTATAVINLGDKENGSAIQPYMFLSTLFIVRNWPLLYAKISKAKQIQKSPFYIYAMLGIFVAIVAISLIMPMIIGGSVSGNVSGKLGEMLPIVYTARNLTQFLYFFLGIIFSIFVSIYIKDSDRFIFAIKAFSYSILFIMGWGLIEFGLKSFSIPYPSQIFNNSANAAAQGFAGLLESGSNRISSVSSEPSILAQNIIVYIPFLLVSIEKRIFLFSKFKDHFLLIFSFFFIILTTSSSGILSYFALVILFFVLKKQSINKKFLTIAGALGMLVLLVPVLYALFPKIIESAIVAKGTSYSAAERLGSIISGINNFKSFPILGVGWGSVTVDDFFVKILANSGILGFIFICITIYIILKRHLRFENKNNNSAIASYFNRGSMLSLIILLFNCEIAGFVFYYGIFWLILGFSMVNKEKLNVVVQASASN